MENITGQKPVDESKKFFGGIYHPWRRFFARILDLSFAGFAMSFIIGFFIAIIISPERFDNFIKSFDNWFVAGFVIYIIYMPVEALFLSMAGTTPAKWMFGIQVLTREGLKLSYPNALKRSLLVWVNGLAFGLPIIAVFAQLLAYRRLLKTGTTYWDDKVSTKVTHEEWGIFRTFTCVMLTFVVLLLLII